MTKRALKYVLSACILLCTSFGHSDPESDVVKETETAALFLPVEIPHDMFWVTCGGINGYYHKGMNVILLCKESARAGLGVSRFIYLHELGHAYTFNHEFSFSRWKENYEAAADEFAAVSAVAQGHAEDVLAMGRYFELRSQVSTWDPKDPHPPMAVRAQTLKRLYYGSLVPWGPLGKEWREALRYWTAEFRSANGVSQWSN